MGRVMRRIAKFETVSYSQFQNDIKDIVKDENEIRVIYNDLILPKRATINSAGYDFKSPISFNLEPNYTIKNNSCIKKNLIYSINNKKKKKNNSIYISNNKRTNHIRNHVKLYSSTCLPIMKTEENKTNNNKYNNKYPIYSNQIFNKTLIIKHSNSLDKNHNNVSLYKDKIISKNKNHDYNDKIMQKLKINGLNGI